MAKLTPLITNANDNLSDLIPNIKEAVKLAKAFTFTQLGIDWDIDVLFTSCLPHLLIDKDGVGGHTLTSRFIELDLEHHANTAKIAEILVHEICHAARWEKNQEYADSLIKEIISEGLSTYLEAVFVKEKLDIQNATTFIKTILNRNLSENKRIFDLLKNDFGSSNFDYNAIFFRGTDKLPKWSGYSLGFFLVQEYIKQTKEPFNKIVIEPYSNFEAFASKF